MQNILLLCLSTGKHYLVSCLFLYPIPDQFILIDKAAHSLETGFFRVDQTMEQNRSLWKLACEWCVKQCKWRCCRKFTWLTGTTTKLNLIFMCQEMNERKNESEWYFHLKRVVKRKKTVYLVLLYFGKLEKVNSRDVSNES